MDHSYGSHRNYANPLEESVRPHRRVSVTSVGRMATRSDTSSYPQGRRHGDLNRTSWAPSTNRNIPSRNRNVPMTREAHYTSTGRKLESDVKQVREGITQELLSLRGQCAKLQADNDRLQADNVRLQANNVHQLQSASEATHVLGVLPGTHKDS